MNYVDLFLFILIALYALVGYKNGFIVSLLGAVRFAVGIPLSYFVSTNYNALVYDKLVADLAREKISQNISQSADIDSLLNGIKDTVSAFPKDFFHGLDLSSLDKLSNDNLSAYIETNIVKPIALVLLEIILFILVFTAFMLVTGLLISCFKLLNKKDKTPLKSTNRFFGLLFGLVKAAAVLLLISTLTEYASELVPKEYNHAFFEQLHSSLVLEYINKINLMI